MFQDSVIKDTLKVRPLPEWLIRQQQGATTGQVENNIIMEDHSLNISLAATGIILIIVVVAATLVIKKKYRRL